MSSPVPATIADEVSTSQPVVRRSRKPWSLAISLVAIVGLAFATSACTPEATAKDAIAKHWGGHAECAERIVQRESRFQADAVNSSSGATGLFQLMPLHAKWIKAELGYEFSEMKDPYKNAQAAKLLSDKNYKAYGDGWAPWRLTGRAAPGGGCPACAGTDRRFEAQPAREGGLRRFAVGTNMPGPDGSSGTPSRGAP